MSAALAEREAWLEARRTCLTATDIGAVLGLNPYESPASVYRKKLGLDQEIEPNDAMQLGTDLEPWIAQMAARDLGVEIVKADFLKHPTCEYFGCTPDYYFGADGLLECKYAGPNAARQFGEPGSDYVPDHYLCQVQWQLFVTGRKFGVLALFAPTLAARVLTFNIPRDDEMIERMAFHGNKFWLENVVKQIAPELSGKKADNTYLESQFPVGSELSVRATDAIEEKLQMLQFLTEEKRSLDDRIGAVQNQVKEFMGEASGLMSDLGTFTYKNQSRTSIDGKALAALLNATPEQVEACTKTTTFRVFGTPFKSGRA